MLDQCWFCWNKSNSSRKLRVVFKSCIACLNLSSIFLYLSVWMIKTIHKPQEKESSLLTRLTSKPLCNSTWLDFKQEWEVQLEKFTGLETKILVVFNIAATRVYRFCSVKIKKIKLVGFSLQQVFYTRTFPQNSDETRSCINQTGMNASCACRVLWWFWSE